MPFSLDDAGFNTQLGQRIRNRRMQLLMSQPALAKHLGLSFQAVQKYEAGISAPPLVRLARMAEVLRVPITYFFEGLMSTSDPEENTGLSVHELRTIGRLRRLPSDVRDALERVIGGALRTRSQADSAVEQLGRREGNG